MKKMEDKIMSEFNWNVYQKAKSPYEAAQNDYRSGSRLCFWGVNLVNMAKQLTKICDNMSATYEEAVADENIYEIQDAERTVEQIKEELIEKQQRINVLQEKQKNGTITEDEKKELETLTGEVKGLKDELSEAIKAETFSIKGLEEKVDKQKSVRDTALDYSRETIHTGFRVIDKFSQGIRGFFARFCGGNKKVEIGEKAVDSGVNLQAVVITSDVMAEVAKAAAEKANETVQEAEKVEESTDVTSAPSGENAETEETKPAEETGKSEDNTATVNQGGKDKETEAVKKPEE